MLGRLIKYELRSTSRIMLFIYAAVLAAGVVLGVVTRVDLALGRAQFLNSSVVIGEDAPGVAGVILIILIALYALLLTVMAVLTIIMIILRFNNSLLQGEGYLMHTLPVPTWMHVASKLIVAFAWEIIAGCVALASMLLIGGISGVLPRVLQELDLPSLFREFLNDTGINLWVVMLMGLMSTILMILHFYFCMAVGNLANQHKMLWAVIAYIATRTVFSIIGVIAGTSILSLLRATPAEIMTHGMILILVLIAACFFGTNYILKNKLNLA